MALAAWSLGLLIADAVLLLVCSLGMGLLEEQVLVVLLRRERWMPLERQELLVRLQVQLEPLERPQAASFAKGQLVAQLLVPLAVPTAKALLGCL